ncbi:NAD(P)-dependent oxidoreductase [Rhodococcus opacus]|nr:NAD(P)-dependent oxidoreductase [Rhodococcus opacus]
MNEKTKVVFAGLGIMGFPIAKRIHEAGFDLTGVDNSEAVRANALAAGIRMTESLIEAVADADVVLMMLPTVEISRLVFDEVLTHAPAASILVQLGTIGYAEAVREAEAARTKGVTYLDAPVIGGGAPAAEAGNLKILAGSDGPIPAGTEQLFRCFSAPHLSHGHPGRRADDQTRHTTPCWPRSRRPRRKHSRWHGVSASIQMWPGTFFVRPRRTRSRSSGSSRRP